MFRLPVSGVEVDLRLPDGQDEVLLAEAASCDTLLALALVGRLARPANGDRADWSALPVTDLEAVLLLIRGLVFGDLVQATTACPMPGCGERLDISFSIVDYLAHHRPRAPRYVEADAETGWYRLRDESVTFRLPTAADLLAAAGQPDPRRVLRQRCVQPEAAPARLVRRAESAMEALAPRLSRTLSSQCPECGSQVDLYFDVQQFALRELRDQAVFVYQDTHLLAYHYHWSESEILALPGRRRAAYAEQVRSERNRA